MPRPKTNFRNEILHFIEHFISPYNLKMNMYALGFWRSRQNYAYLCIKFFRSLRKLRIFMHSLSVKSVVAIADTPYNLNTYWQLTDASVRVLCILKYICTSKRAYFIAFCNFSYPDRVG